MVKMIEELKEKALIKIKNVKNVNELNEAKSEFLGKKSPLQDIMAKMREFSVELKKEIGAKANEFKKTIEDAINLKGTLYYVINEYYVDTANDDLRSLTGMRFAVNVNDPNDYGTLEINAKGDYYIIKERSVNLEY